MREKVRTVESRGIGRVGDLPKPVELGALARKLQRSTEAATVQIVGDGLEKVRRAIILVGAAGSLPFAANPGPGVFHREEAVALELVIAALKAENSELVVAL